MPLYRVHILSNFVNAMYFQFILLYSCVFDYIGIDAYQCTLTICEVAWLDVP